MVAIPRRETAAHVVREALRHGEVVFRRGPFNGVKIFGPTPQDAAEWIDKHPELELVDITAGELAIVITYWQSS